MLGLFPAVNSSNGPRHMKASQFVLGAQVDRERDSRQVNLDRFDDGLSVQLTRCAESTLRFTIDATKLPAELKTPGHVAVLNAWFDFDRSGEWKGSSPCPSGRAAEHAVRNQAVPLESFAATPVQTIEVKITAGQQVKGIWQRASLTLDERFASSASTGRFQHGETEDYGPAKNAVPTGRKGARTFCNPRRNRGLHGRSLRSSFKHRGKPRPRRITLLTRALPKGWTVRKGRTGVSVRAKKDGPERTQSRTLSFRAVRVIGGRTTQRIFVCRFVIRHRDSPQPQTPDAFACDGEARLVATVGQLGAAARNRYQVTLLCNQPIRAASVRVNSPNRPEDSGISMAGCRTAPEKPDSQTLQCRDGQGPRLVFDFVAQVPPSFGAVGIFFELSATNRDRESVSVDQIRPAPVTTG